MQRRKTGQLSNTSVQAICLGVGAGVSVKGNLTDRMAGNLRKAMGMGSKEADLPKQTQPEFEGPQTAAQAAAAAVLVPVGVTAFAVSAYIRSTLCPSLQSYSPQPLPSVSTVNSHVFQQQHLHDMVQSCGVCIMCPKGSYI